MQQYVLLKLTIATILFYFILFIYLPTAASAILSAGGTAKTVAGDHQKQQLEEQQKQLTCHLHPFFCRKF